MPDYVTHQIHLHIKSEVQVELMIRALEQAYRKAEPKDKIIYSRILKKFER